MLCSYMRQTEKFRYFFFSILLSQQVYTKLSIQRLVVSEKELGLIPSINSGSRALIPCFYREQTILKYNKLASVDKSSELTV
jgi:hypothetical protein